jgi:ribosomal protein S18 acetylase RimI-like enzyme
MNKMNVPHIIYNIKTASKHKIYLHLLECNNDFVPPLYEKVNLVEYARKLFKSSVTFEAWSNKKLIGLISAYFNNTKESIGYITNVSVIGDYKGHGIASQLLSNCIQHAANIKFNTLLLEVDKKNIIAINFYKKHNFVNSKNKEKTRILKLIISNIKIEK